MMRNRNAAATAVVVLASIPLTLLAMRHGFGLAATLCVPTACLGFWLALVSRKRANRIGWFTFSTVLAFLLPMGPLWMQKTDVVLRCVQDGMLGFSTKPPFSTSFFEMLSQFAFIVFPWSFVCLIGRLTAICVRSFFENPRAKSDVGDEAIRFSLRRMFFVVLFCAILTSWFSACVHRANRREAAYREAFLQKFKASFTLDELQLLAEPTITELNGLSEQSRIATGVREYRIVAPVMNRGTESWAVWTYACKGGTPGTFIKFGYASASTQQDLPPPPFPTAEDLATPCDNMYAGEAPLCYKASIFAMPRVAKSGQTVEFYAMTGPKMVCDLVIRPSHAITLPPEQKIATKDGGARWVVTIDPAFMGTEITYEFQTRTDMLYRSRVMGDYVIIDKSGTVKLK